MLKKDPGTLPAAYLPLYRCNDGEKVATTMSIFNEWGLVLLKPSQPPSSPVPVSSGEHSEVEEEEATLEGVGETSPPQ